MNKENMKLRESVCTTNRDNTKDVKYGARKFTAIDAYSQIQEATELRGPYGSTRGLRDIEINIDNSYVIMKAVFTYPLGEFPIINNIKLGDDCMKKITTDTLTKALSYLGFNADVFLGQFEDNKYVSKPKPSNQSEDDKERFNDPQFKKFMEAIESGKKVYKDAKEACANIRVKYKLGKDMQVKVEEFITNFS